MKKSKEQIKKKNKELQEKPAYQYPAEFKSFIKKWTQIILNENNFQDYNIREFEFKKWDETNPYCIDRFTGMSMEIDEAYLEFKIYTYPEMHRKYVQLGKDAKLRIVKETLVHEICHTIVTTLASLARERYVTDEQIQIEEEKMTERLARLISYKMDKEGKFKELK